MHLFSENYFNKFLLMIKLIFDVDDANDDNNNSKARVFYDNSRDFSI